MSRDAWILLGIAVLVVGAVTLFFALRMTFRLVAIKRSLNQLGASGKLAFWGALAYLIFPIDLLPDPIYLDDMAVVGGALFFLTRLLRKQETLRGAIPHAERIASSTALAAAAPHPRQPSDRPASSLAVSPVNRVGRPGPPAQRGQRNRSGGGTGESTAAASVTGRAPATNRFRSSPTTSRAGNISRAAVAASSLIGIRPSTAAATRIRLPNRRPRSTPGSAIRHTPPNSARNVAT